MKELFDQLTGNQGLKPYTYQERVAQYLCGGNNIFLCAPTGAGKTWAALLPYLWSKSQRIAFADRLIYVLPLRTLATTLYAETVACCKRVFKVKNLPEERINVENEIVITIQTGEQKNDPFFEGDIVFTTIDQCLSSYLNCPVSLPQRLGNVNAGALLGSLVVFDEFHLLEPGKSMDTAIEMLERLKPFSQFIIMTATLSTKSLNTLREILSGEPVQLKCEEVLSLPSHREKKRTYRWINRPLSSDDVLNHHAGKRSIVILNTVTRAQNIFKELRKKLEESNIKLMLLHSRFYSEDRKNTENDLTEWLGKDAVKTDVILVTTQVVEAGIDISADNLHTELAPLNSIVQRAGRCARYEGKRGVGTVWVYELETNEKGPVLGPYRDNDQKALIENTRIIMEQLPADGEILDFTEELERLDKVHTLYETKYLDSYWQNQGSLKNKVHEAMDGRNETAVRELIRDVASVNVIICNKPDSLRFNEARWPRMLSVPRTSLYNLAPFFEESRDFGETVAWYPTESSNIIDNESDFSFGWECVTAKESLKNVSWLIVINPQFASYSPKLGLQIGVNGDYEEPKYFDRPAIPRYKIHYETYREHVQKVVGECRARNHSYRNATIKLSRKYGVSADRLEIWAVMSCALHDVGKLSIKWQESVRKWQQFKNPQKLTDEPIAHSDYNPETDFEQKIQLPKQPPHAAEGAYAMGQWLIDCMGEDVAVAVWTAIARHHGAFTESLGNFKMIDRASELVKKTLPCGSDKEVVLADEPDNVDQNKFKEDLLFFSKNDDERLWPLYVFLVRRLRLADQKSQKGRD